MMKGRSSKAGGKLAKNEKGTTLIAANTRIVGDLCFKDQLYIDGVVEGNVIADADTQCTVILSEEGSVVGEIRAPQVVINGKVIGNVYATARLELAAKAAIEGNVYYKLIEMQLGAMVDGQLLHSDDHAQEKDNVHSLPVTEEKAPGNT